MKLALVVSDIDGTLVNRDRQLTAGTIDAVRRLTARGLPFRTGTYGPDGIRMLIKGEVQAVVFDAPTLQYWAAKQGNALVEVVGPLFRPQKYGIAVAVASPLRKPINQVLLDMYTDGTYEKIYASWFAASH